MVAKVRSLRLSGALLSPAFTRIILAAALAGHLLAAVAYAISSSDAAGDFDRYYEIAGSAGRPYIDYQVEHPIATLALFKSIALLPGGRASFGLTIVMLNALSDAIIVLSLAWGWGPAAAASYAVAVLPVIDLLFTRIDAWSTAAAILGIASWKRQRAIAAGTAFAIGTAFKLWPLVLTPVLVVPWRSARSVRSAATFFAMSVLLAAVAFSLAGPNSVREVLTFRGATGWQIESAIGSLQNLFGSESPRLENNAFRIGVLNEPVAIGLLAAAVPVCVWTTIRGARAERVGGAWLGAVSILLLISSVFSAQYVIWLTPGAAIALVEGDYLIAGLVVVATTMTQGFLQVYSALLDHRAPALVDYRVAARTLVVFRNLVVLVIAGHAIARSGHRRQMSGEAIQAARAPHD